MKTLVTQPHDLMKKDLEKDEEVYEYSDLIRDIYKPLSIACIPAYNEEGGIASVIYRTSKFVDKVIVCDDGSIDNTAAIAENMGAIVIKHESNRGKGEALRCTLREALRFDYEYFIVIDADGQHNPEDIPLLIEPLHRNEADMVIGSRYIEADKQNIPLYRRFGLSIIDQFFSRGINKDISDSQSGYRAFTRKTVETMVLTKQNGFGADSEQIYSALNHGIRIKEVSIKIQYEGLKNTSKKHPLIHGTEIISSILNLVITERPILYLGIPGLISLLAGLTSLGVFIYYYNMTRYVSIPFALLTATGFILGTMLILVSMVLYAINEVNRRNNIQ